MQLAMARMRNRLLKRRLKDVSLAPQALRNLHALDHVRGRDKALSLSYVVVDLETTGLNLAMDQVCSVGAVRVSQKADLGEDYFYELVNPGCPISPSAQEIHGIFPELVENARSFDDVFDEFLTYLGDDILIAHHARFDLHFLNSAMRRSHGFDLQNLVLDTELMCRHHKVQPTGLPFTPTARAPGLSLGKLAREMGIRVGDRHTAFGDAVMTAEVFLQCLEKHFGGTRCTLRRLLWSAGLI